MAYYCDLSPCTYFDRTTGPLVAVGWLEGGHTVPRGAAAPEFREKLALLLHAPWQPSLFRGTHDCTLCPGVNYTDYETRRVRSPQPGDPPTGHKNLFVPGNGELFVAPELIGHYIDAHGYAPPERFVAAVMRCPAMNSRHYIEAVRANGPSHILLRSLTEWTRLAEREPELERRLLLESTPAQIYRVAHAVCRHVVERSALAAPVIDAVLAALDAGRPASPAQTRAVLDLDRSLSPCADPVCEQHRRPGRECEHRMAARSAIATVFDASTGDPARLCDGLWFHGRDLGEGSALRRVIEAALV